VSIARRETVEVLGLWREALLAGAIALAGMALVGSGCGDGEAKSSGPQARLLVTSDFGREVLDDDELPVKEHRTVIDLLRENHDVEVSKLGLIESIDGRVAGYDQENLETSTRWNFFVNGLKNPTLPTQLPVLEGDVIQFDFEDAIGSEDMRGNVSAFPQPFSSGLSGWRFPVKVVCAKGYAAVCDRVRRTFRAHGVDMSGRRPADPPPTVRERRARALVPAVRRSRLYIGPWHALRDRPIPGRIQLGPDYSGVFAKFSSDGRSLRLLDSHSHPVRTLGAGTGLLGVIRPKNAAVAWFIVGVDRTGVERAARAIDADILDNAFSVAITDKGIQRLPLPTVPTDDE
jgi:hypothetical protein